MGPDGDTPARTGGSVSGNHAHAIAAQGQPVAFSAGSDVSRHGAMSMTDWEHDKGGAALAADLRQVEVRRRQRWCQTPKTRVAGPEEATRLIERVGIATLFPASPEVPNLFHAYVGDPGAQTSSQWDSPSGHVYGWRWALGRREAAFYSVLVRGRPTWMSWTTGCSWPKSSRRMTTTCATHWYGCGTQSTWQRRSRWRARTRWTRFS